MKPNGPVLVEVISGVAGPCLAINERRVAGPKPWGGGRVIQTFHSTRERVMEALGCAPLGAEPALLPPEEETKP